MSLPDKFVKHHMHPLLKPLLSGLLWFCSLEALAQEANPAFWLLMPLAQSVQKCAALGGDAKPKLDSALQAAEANSKKVLPTSVWQLVKEVSRTQANGNSEPSTSENCDGFITQLNDPRFATHFRQYVTSQFVAPLALTCLVRHPARVSTMMTAWVSAYQRQGFAIGLRDVQEAVAGASSPEVQATLLPLSPSECDQLNQELFGPDFDKTYSEEGVLRLFRDGR